MDNESNSKRLRYIVITLFVIALFSALFGQHEHALFLVFNWILVVGLLILFVLYASPFFKPGQGETHLRNDSDRSSTRSKNASELYDNWIGQIEQICQSINEKFSIGIFCLDPTTEALSIQNDNNRHFLSSISPENHLIIKILTSNGTKRFQENESRKYWGGVVAGSTWRGSETILGHRIVFHDQPFGCIFMYTDHFSTLQKRDEDLLAHLAHLFESGLYHMNEIETLEKLHYYSQIIFNLYNKVSQETPLDDVFKHFGDACNQLFDYDAFTLSIKMNAEPKPVVYYSLGEASQSWQGIHFDLQNTIHGHSIHTEEKILTPNWRSDFPDYSRFGRDEEVDDQYSSVISVPILLPQYGLGSLILERKNPVEYSSLDEDLFGVFGQTISTILTWIYSYKSTHQEAIYDHLTGLLNRKAFLDRFNQEIQRAVRFQQNLVILMLDLDKFKQVNDTYGHLYGDYMLRTVSNLVVKNVRDIDVVCRYGGEEFIAILVNTTKSMAEQVGKRIVHSISTYAFEESGIEARITISGGMSDFPNDSEEKRALIKLADEALYEAKRLGGNRIVLYGK